jgi:hypothetical protein
LAEGRSPGERNLGRPAGIPLDLPEISAKLASVNPIAVGVSAKTLANLRSGFLTAVKVSGLKPVQRSTETPLSPAWAGLMARLSGRRAHLGLSRLARYASANGIDPEQVNDAAIEGFIAAVREGSLHRKPNVLHRQVTLIWNEAAKISGVRSVTVASFRAPAKRVDWAHLTSSFQEDVEGHLAWCGGTDVFAADARSRPLAPRTLKLRRNQIHAAVTALVESGIKPSAIRSLADLVSPENFKRILRRRLEAVGGRENAFNRDLAEALVQIGREWVKLEPGLLDELKRLTSKMPMPAAGLTPKNKASLRQFDDPAVLQRLIDLMSPGDSFVMPPFPSTMSHVLRKPPQLLSTVLCRISLFIGPVMILWSLSRTINKWRQRTLFKGTWKRACNGENGRLPRHSLKN